MEGLGDMINSLRLSLKKLKTHRITPMMLVPYHTRDKKRNVTLVTQIQPPPGPGFGAAVAEG